MPISSKINQNYYRNSTPAKILNNVISNAMKKKASDIHFESVKNGILVRYRVDGILHIGKRIPDSLKQGVISHIKVLANLDIAEKRRPQDGKLKYNYSGNNLDIRVSTIPILHGEKLVLRILDSNTQNVSLDTLGLLEDQKSLLCELLKTKQGIILVTGPTGSGKTTTLYTMLNLLKTPEVNIVTVEDPVEYEIPGINQTNVHPAIDYTFASALRSFLRQDPDIIFIGEIRDTETAKIAIRAALTGHLVFSTVHTNSSVETIVRLMDMEVEPYLLASTLKLVIAQRLIRKLCKFCDNLESLRMECIACNNTGYSGREGIFELLPISNKIKELIHDKASMNTIRDQEEVKRIITLEKAGAIKISDNITTIEEVKRVIN